VQRRQEDRRGRPAPLDSSLRYATPEIDLDNRAPYGFTANNVFGIMPNRGTYDMRTLNQSGVDRNSPRNFEVMQQVTSSQQRTSSRDMPARRGATPLSRYSRIASNRTLPATRDPTPVQKSDRLDFSDVHNLDSRLHRFRPDLSVISKIHENGQSLLSRVPLIASAPGSRMPSREATAEPAEDKRAPSRMPPSEQLQGMNRMPRTVVKDTVARDLTQPVC
jgi:hypothetical protein